MEAFQGGTIVGFVSLAGTPPASKTFIITKSQQRCGNTIPDESLIVGAEKGIKNTLVYIKSKRVDTGNPLGAKVVIKQENCQLRPRIAIARVGVSVEVVNQDDISDAIVYYGVANPQVSARPMIGKKITWTFAQPEIMKVISHAHPWTQSWLIVLDHPYAAVTDERGNFRMTDVPPGEYTAVFWHEVLGVQEKRVVVAERGETRLDVEFSR